MSLRALEQARAMLGVRFRLHGRERDGVDCIGLVGVAWCVAVPTGYPLRSAPRDRIERALADLDFVASEAGPGAILLIAAGPGQLHLAIANGAGGAIHADAVARRVVERPAPLPWPVLGAWTREEG